MPTDSQTLGALGEELAFHFLLRNGYKVLLKNYECPLGEIDLIAKHEGAVVFIEVKTRRSRSMGPPAESVTFHKRHQIVKTAQYYLKRYGIQEVACRFDVVSILMPEGDEPCFELVRNAFGEGE
ncbi:MAG: YraN family protein [Candidatus Omnitrophica bacterium]|nr:YraN family protein [Candidatus Omnitrophota bacterium]